MNVPAGQYWLLHLLEMLMLTSINVNIIVYIHYSFLFILFTFILVNVVCEFFFTCLQFCLMLVFVVILSSMIICKQICLLYCFAFAVFVYNFNVKRTSIKIFPFPCHYVVV